METLRRWFLRGICNLLGHRLDWDESIKNPEFGFMGDHVPRLDFADKTKMYECPRCYSLRNSHDYFFGL